MISKHMCMHKIHRDFTSNEKLIFMLKEFAEGDNTYNTLCESVWRGLLVRNKFDGVTCQKDSWIQNN